MFKILVIDDEAPVRKMLTKLLERNGFDVIAAVDGCQGIKRYHENHPDLVITDLIMPEKEGLESIREIKKINPDVHIIAISGGGIADPQIYLEFASKLGAVRTFAKPVDNEILVSTIKELLG